MRRKYGKVNAKLKIMIMMQAATLKGFVIIKLVLICKFLRENYAINFTMTKKKKFKLILKSTLCMINITIMHHIGIVLDLFSTLVYFDI